MTVMLLMMMIDDDDLYREDQVVAPVVCEASHSPGTETANIKGFLG